MYCRTILLFVLAVVLASDRPVGAQGFPASWAPYGTLRGRIRVVEGPRRSVYHARWGNGLTPYGAQVLTTGLTVAGDVLPAVLLGRDDLSRKDSREVLAAEKLAKEMQTLREEFKQLRQSVEKIGETQPRPQAASDIDAQLEDYLLNARGLLDDLTCYLLQLKSIKDQGLSISSGDMGLRALIHLQTLQSRLDVLGSDIRISLVEWRLSGVELSASQSEMVEQLRGGEFGIAAIRNRLNQTREKLTSDALSGEIDDRAGPNPQLVPSPPDELIEPDADPAVREEDVPPQKKPDVRN